MMHSGRAQSATHHRHAGAFKAASVQSRPESHGNGAVLASKDDLVWTGRYWDRTRDIGFRHWHQIPFLNGMPDRGFERHKIKYHFFGDKDYAAVTGWPNMIQTVSHDGWMGIAPAGKKITMKSLDFWRIEDGLIRENWVMVDILEAYRDLGVDVFARLREFNKARNMGRIHIPSGME